MDLFSRLKRALRRERPPMLPTRVYVRPVEERTAGITIPNADSTRYRIHIWDELEEHEHCETLVHEWAHVVRGTFCRNVHDALYWIEHGRCDAVWQQVAETASRKEARDGAQP